jgi:hypothetical protein
VRLAADGPGVHVVWSEGKGGHQEIFYRGSTDGGASFGSILTVSNSPESVQPAIAVSGTNVYLAWRAMGVRFATSADGGATFTAPVDLAPGWTDTRGVAGFPAIAASGTSVQVMWHDDSFGTYQLFHRASADSGATFGPQNTISLSAQDCPPDCSQAVIKADGTHVYLAWRDLDSEVLLLHSADKGATFGAPVNVSQSPGVITHASDLATTPTEIYVVWSDTVLKQSEVFFARGTVP